MFVILCVVNRKKLDRVLSRAAQSDRGCVMVSLDAWEVIVSVLGIVLVTATSVATVIWKLSGDKGKGEMRLAHLEKDYEKLAKDFDTLHKRIDSRETEIKVLDDKMDELNNKMNKMHVDLLTAIHQIQIDKRKEVKDA